MSHTAYLVIFVDGATLKLKSAGIYSEPGQTLSMEGCGQVVAATVFECSGDSYQEARDSVVENCKMWPPARWLLDHIR